MENIEFISVKMENSKKDLIKSKLNLIDEIFRLESIIFSNSVYSQRQIEEMLGNENYSFYIALKNRKEVIAYLITLDSIDVEEIIKIGTLEEYRGTGVSKKLLEEFFNEKDKNVVLEVRESNLRGIKFYEKNGFKIVSKRKNYYKDNNETALIMLLERQED